MSRRVLRMTLLSLLATASGSAALETATVQPDPAAPGDILVIEVSAHPSRATFALNALRFFKWRGKFRALAGIDIETPPGSRELSLRWTQAPPIERIVNIRAKNPAEKSPPGPVPDADVSPDVKERIWSEAQRLDTLFRRVSPQMMWTGPFQKPVEAPVGAPFGFAIARDGRRDRRIAGIDFRVEGRLPVRAANSGDVVLADELYDTGKTVIVDHGFGLYTVYGRLGGIEVRPRQRVARGALLGEVGTAGEVSSLYWGARLFQAKVDPTQLLTLE